MIEYFVTPDYCIAKNHGVQSTSIGASIAYTYYPDIYESVSYMPGQYRFLVPTEKVPTKPVIMLFRDPISKFFTMKNKLGKTIDEALSLIDTDPHFALQTRYIYDHPKPVTVFFMETGLKDFIEEAGLKDYPHLNKSIPMPINCSLDELQRVVNVYIPDIVFYHENIAHGIIDLAP